MSKLFCRNNQEAHSELMDLYSQDWNKEIEQKIRSIFNSHRININYQEEEYGDSFLHRLIRTYTQNNSDNYDDGSLYRMLKTYINDGIVFVKSVFCLSPFPAYILEEIKFLREKNIDINLVDNINETAINKLESQCISTRELIKCIKTNHVKAAQITKKKDQEELQRIVEEEEKRPFLIRPISQTNNEEKPSSRAASPVLSDEGWELDFGKQV